MKEALLEDGSEVWLKVIDDVKDTSSLLWKSPRLREESDCREL